LNIGEWVHTCHNMNKITGYIVGVNANEVTVFATIPKNYGEITLRKSEVWLADNTIWMDDIPALIDLSLTLKDKDWFEKWVNEMSLWKTVNILQ
jgi:hypothetical protein